MESAELRLAEFSALKHRGERALGSLFNSLFNTTQCTH